VFETDILKTVSDFGAPTLVTYILVRDVIGPLVKYVTKKHAEPVVIPSFMPQEGCECQPVQILRIEIKGDLELIRDRVDMLTESVGGMEGEIKEILSRMTKVETHLDYMHKWRQQESG
jgi:hypothetical protein